MSRALDPTVEEAIEEKVVRPFLAALIDLPDPVYAFTGIGTLTFDDASGVEREWIGAGRLGAFDNIEESTDGSATGVRVTLLEVPSSFRDDIAQQATRGAKFETYIGVIEQGGSWHSVLGRKLLRRDRLDKYEIADAGDTLSVQITGESRAIDQRRPAIKRFTDEYQQRKHSGDDFFQYVPQMVEVPILWAKAEDSTVTSGGGGSGIGGGSGGFYGRALSD